MHALSNPWPKLKMDSDSLTDSLTTVVMQWTQYGIHFEPSKCLLNACYDWFSSLVGMEQRWFEGWRDLDYSALRVQWLCTLLCRKAEVQGTRLSKPEKKGTCLIRNSRDIAA